MFAENEFLAASRTFLKTQVDRPVRLALNGVGGRSALLVSSALGYGGTMVTYGRRVKNDLTFDKVLEFNFYERVAMFVVVKWLFFNKKLKNLNLSEFKVYF